MRKAMKAYLKMRTWSLKSIRQAFALDYFVMYYMSEEWRITDSTEASKTDGMSQKIDFVM